MKSSVFDAIAPQHSRPTSAMKRRSQFFLVSIATYLCLWGLTAAVGIRQLQAETRAAIRQLEEESNRPYQLLNELPQLDQIAATPFRSYFASAYSPAPFLILSQGFVRISTDASHGRRMWLWLFGVLVCLRDSSSDVGCLPADSVVGWGAPRQSAEIASSFGIHAEVFRMSERERLERYPEARCRAEVGVWRESPNGRRDWIEFQTSYVPEEREEQLFTMRFRPRTQYEARGVLRMFRTNTVVRATVHASVQRNGETVWSSQETVDVKEVCKEMEAN